MKIIGILANRLKDQAVTKISESTCKLTEATNNKLTKRKSLFQRLSS